MDNIISNFTTRDGRIGRQSWWIGAIILAVILVVISLFILPLVGLGMNANDVIAAANDPALMATLISTSVSRAAWGGLIVFLIFAYPIYCLGIKRRHDKDNNGVDLLVFMALTVIAYLLQALGMTMTTVTLAGVTMPTPSVIGWILSLVQFVFGIYMLVVLGILRGTVGPNQYGPDPVGGAA